MTYPWSTVNYVKFFKCHQFNSSNPAQPSGVFHLNQTMKSSVLDVGVSDQMADVVRDAIRY